MEDLPDLESASDFLAFVESIQRPVVFEPEQALEQKKTRPHEQADHETDELDTAITECAGPEAVPMTI